LSSAAANAGTEESARRLAAKRSVSAFFIMPIDRQIEAESKL
jgi:hypothetical protein